MLIFSGRYSYVTVRVPLLCCKNLLAMKMRGKLYAE
jgi:hypothetical protein